MAKAKDNLKQNKVVQTTLFELADVAEKSPTEAAVAAEKPSAKKVVAEESPVKTAAAAEKSPAEAEEKVTAKKVAKKTSNKTTTRITTKRELKKDEEDPKALAKKRAEHKRLVKIKSDVKEMERRNHSNIYVFCSGYPWFKVGFRSALIYEYFINPHLPKPIFKLSYDDDSYAYSRTGLFRVRSILRFAETMIPYGVELPEQLQPFFDKDGHLIAGKKPPTEAETPDYYIFKISGMTEAKIRTYLDERFRENDELNRLALPFYIPERLYPDSRYLAQTIADLVRQFPVEFRATYGRHLAELSISILRDINVACNGFGGFDGQMTYMRALNQTVFYATEISEIVRVLIDARVIKPGSGNLVLKGAMKVIDDAQSEMIKMSEQGRDPIVDALKKRKNFPKGNPINLSYAIQKKAGDEPYTVPKKVERTNDEEE